MSDVISFGAEGDGQTDDTEAIRHAIGQGDGVVRFGRGSYRITETIEIPLDQSSRLSLEGHEGTAKIIMAGPGPAFRFVGTHGGTADPLGVKPSVWERQRLPLVSGIEIEGAHDEADGIALQGTFQPILSRVLLRDLRHGVVLARRNRNVLISDCQIYHNRGVGIYLKDVNLHQINITGNHISYNRLGGIRIEGSEIRNLQITGNDIEYNNYRSHEGFEPSEPTAEIFIDTRERPGQVMRASVRELTISSNTIQSTYSPGGANLRILGPDADGTLPPGMAAISGNVIGNQAINVHLVGCRGIALSGNFIYSGFQHNVLADDCDDLVFGANSFGHNYWGPKREIDVNVRLVDCSDCVLNGFQLRGAPSGKTDWDASWNGGESREHPALLELERCQRMNIAACVIRDPGRAGVWFRDCDGINLSGCQIHDTRKEKQMRHAVEWHGEGRDSLAHGNQFGAGVGAESLAIDSRAGVTMSDNLETA